MTLALDGGFPFLDGFPLLPRLSHDDGRKLDLAFLLAADPAVERLFLEPHLQARLGLSDPRIRFPRCRAARHDDHIHVQTSH